MSTYEHVGATRDRNFHFDRLTRAEQESAIRRMARDGYSVLAIAAATRLSGEQVKQILSPQTQ